MPADRAKTRRHLLTPLTPLAVELLGELRDIFGDTKWLFPARNVAWATQPWGSTAMGHAVRNAGYDWTARDLRRTWKRNNIGKGDTSSFNPPTFPLVPPGLIVSIAGLKGVSRSVRISAQWSGDSGLQVKQIIGLERREVE